MLISQRLFTFRSAFTCDKSFLFWVIYCLFFWTVSWQSVDLNSLLSNFAWKICKGICTSTEKYLQTHKAIHTAGLSCSGNISVNHLISCFWWSSLGSIMIQVYTTNMLQMTAYNWPGVQLLHPGACSSRGPSYLLGLDPTGSATHFHTFGFMQRLDTRTGWTRAIQYDLARDHDCGLHQRTCLHAAQALRTPNPLRI